jgi:hypothetical protein
MHFMSGFGIDLIAMIHYLESQPLTSEELLWLRDRNIQQIVELASHKGYYVNNPTVLMRQSR